jgi:hypothetical protein
MKKNQIQIYKKKHTKGKDGYKTFSIRIKEETVAALDKIAAESNRSRNELINIFLKYGAENYEIVE